MTKRQKQNHRIAMNHYNFLLALCNKRPTRYATLMDATAKQNPIIIGQAGYDDAIYEERCV